MCLVFNCDVCDFVFVIAMNVYDFDKTIYNGDSTVDFFWFALRRKPLVIRYIPKQMLGFFLYGIRRITKTKLKEYFFSFLSGIDAEKMAEEFWDKNYRKICKWYLLQQAHDDIVISASPEFLLKPICRRLQIQHLIASEVNAKTGRFLGENCYAEEKVRRLVKEYNITHIDEFYSDSCSDLPLAQMADKAFLVSDQKLIEWK